MHPRERHGAKTAKPIHIAHVFTGDAAAAMYPRVVAIVEPDAQVTLIESFTGPEGLDYQVNSAFELTIGDKAMLGARSGVITFNSRVQPGQNSS